MIDKGRNIDVYSYVSDRGEVFLTDFFNSLNEEKKQVLLTLRLLLEKGELKPPKIKKVKGNIREIRIRQIRLFYFTLNAVKNKIMILNHGIVKKRSQFRLRT